MSNVGGLKSNFNDQWHLGSTRRENSISNFNVDAPVGRTQKLKGTNSPNYNDLPTKCIKLKSYKT